jgi:uncharacterized protein (TIGR00369 family)
MTDDILEKARRVVAAQPFSAMLGAELLAFGGGAAELKVPITAQVMQQHGFVHGGVISYAADNALTLAGGTTLGPDVVTSEFKINYVRPAIGEFLVARGTVVHTGANQAVCRCDVYVSQGGSEKLCATAQGTIVKITGR